MKAREGRRKEDGKGAGDVALNEFYDLLAIDDDRGRPLLLPQRQARSSVGQRGPVDPTHGPRAETGLLRNARLVAV